MSGRIVAVIQSLIAPFSPLRRDRNRGDDAPDNNVRAAAAATTTPATTTGNNVTVLVTPSPTGREGEGDKGRTNKKRKRGRKLDGDGSESKNSTTDWGTKKQKFKAGMSDNELCSYFMTSLNERMESGCGNKCCKCMDILGAEKI